MNLALIIIVTLCGLTMGSKVPIQAHSFNDLGYLKNIINKGIDYFKLDVSMADRQSCLKHSTWRPNNLCLNTSEYVQQICCLGFRGDASSRPNFGYNFSTPDEFITLLEQIMPKIQPERQILFAINFQYNFFFEDFLTQKFLSEIANLLAKYPKQLLIGTGSDNFILEYDRICAYKATSQCTDTRKKISNSEIFLQTGSYNPYDSRDVYKRFRNFNIMFLGIQSYCKNGFPEWIHKYKEFPLIFWQPSDQSQIQYIFNKILDPNCIKKHNRTIDEIAIATNIDKQMFELYMKKTTDISLKAYQDWNISSQKALVVGLDSMKLTKITAGSKQSLFGISKNITSKRAVLLLFELDSSNNQKMKLTSKKEISIIPTQQQILSIADTQKDIVVITVSNDYSTLYIFDYNLNLIQFQKKQKSIIVASLFDYKSSQLIVVCKLTTDGNYSIEITKDFQNYKIFVNISTTLLISSMTIYQNFILLAGSEQFGSHGSLAKMIGIDRSTGQIVHQNIILTRGSNPQIIHPNFDNNNLQILIQNSMCHSAILINNNDMNKCSFYNENQFQDIANVKGLINRISGKISDIIDNSQKTNNTQNEKIIGPCHKTIRFTKLANGQNPNSIYLEKAGYSIFTMKYLRVEQQDFIGAVFCGGSNYEQSFRSLSGTLIYTSNYQSINENQKPNIKYLRQ